MCTLTAFLLSDREGSSLYSVSPDKGTSGGGVLRIGFNRDEMRKRGPGIAPMERVVEGRKAVYPVDSDSGGTWIGLNDAGLAFALLNVNPTPGSPAARRRMRRIREENGSIRSRGGIIPSLLGASSLEEVGEKFRDLDRSHYEPFHLAVMSRAGYLSLLWDGEDLQERRNGWEHPPLYTSSGLGDALVERARTPLYREFFGLEPLLSGSSFVAYEEEDAESDARRMADFVRTDRRTEPVSVLQDRFHRHRWEHRPHLSICMDRPHARTMSHTLIELDDAEAKIDYFDRVPFPETPSLRSVLKLKSVTG